MTVCTIKIVGLVKGPPTPFDGEYLVEYDPDRDGIDPAGNPMAAQIRTTPNRHDARVFVDAMAAHAEWTRVDQRNPVRLDGKPNRPLTAFTVSVEPL